LKLGRIVVVYGPNLKVKSVMKTLKAPLKAIRGFKKRHHNTYYSIFGDFTVYSKSIMLRIFNSYC